MKRFFYVNGPSSRVVHRLYGARVEGNKTACGIVMQVFRGRPRWVWNRERGKKKVCKRCEASAG